MLTDPAGEPMAPTHASKAGRRYRYYVSSRLITGTRDDHADALRVPAAALERVVATRIARLLADGPELLGVMRSAAVLPEAGAEQRGILVSAQNLAHRWHQQRNALQRDKLLTLGVQVAVQRHEVAIHLAPHRLLTVLSGKIPPQASDAGDRDNHHFSRIAITEPVALRRAGREMALLVGSTVAGDRSDPSLVRLIAKASALREALVSSTDLNRELRATEQGSLDG
jgi:hypothetical protein